MSLKSIFTSLIALGFTFPIIAQGGDLSIINNTNYDSTSIINEGACSTLLGEIGTTRAHNSNVIPEYVVNMACLLNQKNCRADVYLTNNCTGPVIATVFLDTKTGVKSWTVNDATYHIEASGFSISLS